MVWHLTNEREEIVRERQRGINRNQMVAEKKASRKIRGKKERFGLEILLFEIK